MKVWHALELEIARDAEAAVTGQLWISGTTGIEISEDVPELITLRAWFTGPPDEARVRAQVERAIDLADLPAQALRAMKSVTIADEDWLLEWKKSYEPIAIGERLLVTPSWKHDEVRGTARIVIEIDPGMAFGTGTHETTRSCLELLERVWQGGSLLDVGTGTGILAIAAAKLSPGARVVGFDIDPDAIAVASENASINSVADRVDFEVNSLSTFRGEGFDLVLANLTADVLVSLAAEFAQVVRTDGTLIVSGILLEQTEDVRAALAAEGFSVIESKPDGEWITLALRAPSE